VNLLFPLDRFYRVSALPRVERIDGGAIPEPLRHLLVHEDDMTPTLEAFHGARIHLDLLQQHMDGDSYCRLVVLRLDGSETPVEFGAIAIHLDLFPPAAREEILEGHKPLGTVLTDHSVRHWSCPRAYLRVNPSPPVCQALGTRMGEVHYGRRNVHLLPDGRVLADILEILPPHPRGGPCAS